jgi:hypothetical protein
MAHTAEQIVRTYLSRLAEIRSTGGATNETSYYSALEALLNDVGRRLDPHVICNGQLRNQGADIPISGCTTRSNVKKDSRSLGKAKSRSVASSR